MASSSSFLVSPPLTSRPKDLRARCCISPTFSSAQYVRLINEPARIKVGLLEFGSLTHFCMLGSRDFCFPLRNQKLRPQYIAISGINISSSHFLRYSSKQRSFMTICQASTVAAPPVEETKVCSLPTWAEFELGRAPVYWKTVNGLPPTSGEDLTIFYNPAASKLILNDEYGVAFNGGFNQPIMCGGEPRVMTRRDRGEADLPFYTIKIRPPKHAVNLIFSFTNGVDWDGPYKLQFQVQKAWRNKPIEFFNKGLAEELSIEGACAEAIFPDSHVVIESCEIENLYYEGGDRCKLDLVPGCMDPNSPNYDPLANVDDGTCPLESDSDEE